MPPYKEALRRRAEMYKHRKHPRLKEKSLYTIPHTIVHLTIGTHAKKPYFSDPKIAESLISIMKRVSLEKGNRIYAYCVMPDHIHILVDASDKCGVIDFVKLVKGRFAGSPPKTWLHTSLLQRSFYDHILRKDEDVMAVARYIIANPVRAGIVDEMGKYPFAGSLVYDL